MQQITPPAAAQWGSRTVLHSSRAAARSHGSRREPARARQGSIRASHWVGGGKAMAPKSRDYTYRPPRKVRQGALKAALSLRAKEKAIIIVERFNLDCPLARPRPTHQVLTRRMKSSQRARGRRQGQTTTFIDQRSQSRQIRCLSCPRVFNRCRCSRHKRVVMTSAAAKALEGSP